jgi:hypothetical protein
MDMTDPVPWNVLSRAAASQSRPQKAVFSPLNNSDLFLSGSVVTEQIDVMEQIHVTEQIGATEPVGCLVTVLCADPF